MRRKDREVIKDEEIDKIISNCYCCRLGFQDEGNIYMVPLSFGYEKNNGRRIFYFHSAKEGRKIDLIRKNHYAGFELDTNYKLKEGTKACSYSARFQSVTGSVRWSLSMIRKRGKRHSGLSCVRIQEKRNGSFLRKCWTWSVHLSWKLRNYLVKNISKPEFYDCKKILNNEDLYFM